MVRIILNQRYEFAIDTEPVSVEFALQSLSISTALEFAPCWTYALSLARRSCRVTVRFFGADDRERVH